MKMGASLTGHLQCLTLLNIVMIGGELAGVSVRFNGQLFSGRPCTHSVEDFEDRLLAAFAKAKLREKKLTKAEFLLQLPAYLEHEALQL
jgi:hypothetical protein